MLRSSISLLVFVVALGNAVLLPDYFEKCSLSDPYLNKCLTKNAIDAWPILVAGDKSVHIQSLDPLYVSFIQGTISNQLVANASTVVINGLADSKIEEIKFDQEKKTWDINFLMPKFNFNGNCKVQGSIINLPIDGEGIINFALENLNSHLQINYDLVKRRDEHYIEINKNILNYNITSMHYNFDYLGDAGNQFLNENWEEINRVAYEPITIALGEMFTEIVKHFFKKVSFEELFLK